MLKVGARASVFVFLENFYVLAFLGYQKKKGDEQGSQSGKVEVVTHGNLKVKEHATGHFKISFPLTVSLL